MSEGNRLRSIEKYLDRAKTIEGVSLGSLNNPALSISGQTLTLTLGAWATTHYEILQDSAGAILTDENNEILYVEVNN